MGGDGYPVNLTTPHYNYVGPTVLIENAIYLEAFEQSVKPRASYYNTLSSTDLGQIDSDLSRSLTDKHQVGLVLEDQLPFNHPGSGKIDVSERTEDVLLLGMSGIDSIKSGSGDDYLYGGDGADNLEGGPGRDHLFGNSGVDVISGNSASPSDPEHVLPAIAHPEWDDGVRDYMSGGTGDDVYVLYSNNRRGEAHPEVIHDIVDNKIDYIDATDGDFTAYFQYRDSVLDLHTFTITATDFVDAINSYDAALGYYVFGESEFENEMEEVRGTEVGNDLYLSIGNGGGILSVLGGFYNVNKLARPDINGTSDDDGLHGTNGSENIRGGAGSDTIYGGRGNDSIDGDGGDNQNFHRMVATSEDFDIVTYDGQLSDYTITQNIDGSFTVFSEIYGTDTITNVEGFEFSDANTFYSAAELLGGSSPVNLVQGTSADDEIIGSMGNDFITGGAGDDYLYGNIGSDIYVYASGDGNDEIDDDAPYVNNVDVLQLTDLNQNDVTITREGRDLLVTVNQTAEEIYVTNQFASRQDAYGIEKIAFADGSELGKAFIDELSHVVGTDNDDVLDGQYNYDDVIIGGKGADNMDGRSGNDNYIYHAGDGNDLISDVSGVAGDQDILQLHGIARADVTLSRAGEQLRIADAGTGAVITIDHQYTPGEGDGVEKIVFDDGTFFDNQDFGAISAATPLAGTSGHDFIFGSRFNDVYQGSPGDDWLWGYGGSDTYNYKLGDGDVMVSDESLGDSANDFDVLKFADIALSDVTFAPDEDFEEDLVITVTSTGDRILVNYELGDDLAKGIEEIQFTGGVTLTRADILAMEL